MLQGRKDELNVSQVSNSILQNQRVIVLQVHLNGRAETRALGEENQVLELEQTLNHLIGVTRLVDLHCIRVLRHDSLLLSKIALAPENQVSTGRSNLYIQLLPQSVHVPADLLEIDRRHVNDVTEVEVGDLDLVNVRVKEFEEVVGDRRLLGVLHANPQLVGIGRGQVERKRVIVPHGLDQLEEVDHVHPEDVLGGAEVVLEAIMK